jgi:hypothetical protein
MTGANRETFRWGFDNFDITKINNDIRLRLLIGKSALLLRTTIEWYGDNILGLKDRNARLIPQAPSIDVEHLKTLTPQRLDEPIVLTYILRFENNLGDFGAGLDVPGALQYDTLTRQMLKPVNLSAADVVVIDGNHRLASAYYNGKDAIAGFLLSVDQAEKYKIYDSGGNYPDV